MSDPAWLDRKALAARYSLSSKRAVARLERLGKLPAPSYHLGPNSPRWRTLEVEALLLGKPMPRSADQVTVDLVQRILRAK